MENLDCSIYCINIDWIKKEYFWNDMCLSFSAFAGDHDNCRTVWNINFTYENWAFANGHQFPVNLSSTGIQKLTFCCSDFCCYFYGIEKQFCLFSFTQYLECIIRENKNSIINNHCSHHEDKSLLIVQATVWVECVT